MCVPCGTECDVYGGFHRHFKTLPLEPVFNLMQGLSTSITPSSNTLVVTEQEIGHGRGGDWLRVGTVWNLLFGELEITSVLKFLKIP